MITFGKKCILQVLGNVRMGFIYMWDRLIKIVRLICLLLNIFLFIVYLFAYVFTNLHIPKNKIIPKQYLLGLFVI